MTSQAKQGRDLVADAAHLLDSVEAIAKRIQIFKTITRVDEDKWSCPEWFDRQWNNWTIFPEDQRAVNLDNCAVVATVLTEVKGLASDAEVVRLAVFEPGSSRFVGLAHSVNGAIVEAAGVVAGRRAEEEGLAMEFESENEKV